MKREKTGCVAYVKERLLYRLKRFVGCTVLVPSLLNEEVLQVAVRDIVINHTRMAPVTKEAAIIPIDKLPLRQATTAHETGRTVRYPRFLSRHRSSRLVAHAIN